MLQWNAVDVTNGLQLQPSLRLHFGQRAQILPTSSAFSGRRLKPPHIFIFSLPFLVPRWLQTNTMRPKTLQTSSLWTVEGPPLLVEAIFASPRSHVSRPPGKPPPTTSSCLPPFPATRGSPPPPACAPHTNHCCVFMFKSFQFGSKVQLPPCDAIPWDHHHHTPITSYHQKPIQVENFCQDPVWYVLMLESFL